MATFHGIPSDDIEQLSETLSTILALDAKAFLHFLRNVLPPTARLPWNKRYLSIAILRSPYDSYKDILKVEPRVLPLLFPKLNRHVPIVMNGATGVWAAHDLISISPEPPIVKLTNNLDFMGYADDDSRLYKEDDWRMFLDHGECPVEGERMEGQIVAKCTNLEIVTIDICIDDAFKMGTDGKRQQTTRAAMMLKNEFTKLCPRKHARLRTLQYRWVGKDQSNKKDFTSKAMKEATDNLNKQGVKVIEKRWGSWGDTAPGAALEGKLWTR